MRSDESRTAETAPPVASVLIVAYNGRKCLDECLASVLDQDFPQEQYEVIVVDNASRDGSAEFVEQHYPKARILRLPKNYGPGEAIHRALAHVRGRYIAYLNQDCVAHRRWLQELVEVITNHPQAGIVESNMLLPQWPEYAGRRREGLIERAYVCDLTSLGVHDFSMVPVTPTTAPIQLLSAYGGGCIIDPQIIERLGYWFDPGFFAYFDDIDIGLRLNAAGYQVLLAPRSVIYHDTDWHLKLDKRSLRRMFLSTRNMFLVFFKLCYPSEFFALLPQLMLGKLLKAGQHSTSRVGRWLYAVAGIPLLLVGFTAALLKMPAYRQLRSVTMSHRKMACGWLVDCLRNHDWRPNPAVWTQPAPVAKDGQTTEFLTARAAIEADK